MCKHTYDRFYFSKAPPLAWPGPHVPEYSSEWPASRNCAFQPVPSAPITWLSPRLFSDSAWRGSVSLCLCPHSSILEARCPCPPPLDLPPLPGEQAHSRRSPGICWVSARGGVGRALGAAGEPRLITNTSLVLGGNQGYVTPGHTSKSWFILFVSEAQGSKIYPHCISFPLFCLSPPSVVSG